MRGLEEVVAHHVMHVLVPVGQWPLQGTTRSWTSEHRQVVADDLWQLLFSPSCGLGLHRLWQRWFRP